MNEQCKIRARKSDATHTENHQKRSSKGNQKPSKNLSKLDSSKKFGKRRSGPLEPGRPSAPVRLLEINKTH